MPHKPLVTLSQADYELAEEELAGICCECCKLVNHGSVEPDADGYECEDCGELAVIGVPNGLLMGLIAIGEETTEAEQ